MKKLNLNKERIATLSNLQMRNVLGGFSEEEEYEELESDSGEAASGSTKHNFTCDWCLAITFKYKKGKEKTLN